jgi:RHS repeat-associated protein
VSRPGFRLPRLSVRQVSRPVAVVTASVLLMSGAEVVAASTMSSATAAPAAAAPVERVGSRPDRVSAAAAARAQGSRVKVDGEGSPSAETFVNPDGSMTAEAYSLPSFRRAGAARDGGAWVPLTGALAGTGTADDPFVADGLARRVTLGRSAAGLLSVDLPGGPVSFSASGLTLRSPSRSGSTVSFSDAATDTDLQLVVSPEGVKTNLVLRTVAAPRSFRFHVSDPQGLLGEAVEQPDGSFRFGRDLGDGWHLGLAPATAYVPAEVDPALGPGVDRSSASQTVTRVGDGWDVVLAVNPDWLAGKAFPVVLDPSPTFVAAGTGTQGVDCHLVANPYNNISYCGQSTRDIGLAGGVVRRTIVMFGLDSIPPSSVVSSADLDLYEFGNEQGPGSYAVQANRLTQGWNQSASWSSTGSGAWSTAGGTYVGPVLATTTVDSATFGHYHWALSPSAVQGWVALQQPNYGVVLQASPETTVGVMRFRSANWTDVTQRPRLTVTYNTPPGRPAGRAVYPCAAQCASPVATSTVTPILAAQSADSDAAPLRYDFEVYAGSSASPTTLVTSGSVPNAQPGSRVQWRVPAGALSAGSTYEYRVRAYDGALYSSWSSGWVVFTPDTTLPTAPALSSTAWSNGGWGGPAAGTITYSATDPGGTIAGYSTQLDDEEWTDYTASTSRALSGLTEGRHTVAVRAQDKAGNVSPTTTWSIGVNVGGIDSPAVEAQTAARVTVAASAQTGRDWIKWQYQLGTTGTFADVPLADVTVPGTSTHPASWPVQRSGGTLPPYVWDVASTAGPDGLVQVRVCLGTSSTDPSPVCTGGRTIQLSRAAGSYATTTAGPGSVSLLTGDLTVSESDVDVPSYNGSLSIGRTLTTLTPSTVTTGAAGVFGPAWTASLPGPEAGAADVTVLDKSAAGYMALVAEDGTQDLYAQTSSAGGIVTYTGVGEAGSDGATLTKNGSTLTLADLDGTSTVWTLSGSTWGITSVTEPGTPANSTTSYTRDGSGRVIQILAPVPAGVSCASPLITAGCRTLTLTYASSTTATGTAPAQWGNYLGRLQQVTFTAYDPGTSTMVTKAVAAYSYDSAGLLRAAWDPRISPALTTTYTYGTGNRLVGVTPPGLSGWTVGYDGTNRITTLTRPNPSGGTQTTTVRYGVPFTGTGAPVDLGASQTAGWGQTDLPTTATAVWGPDRVPAATPSTTDWQYADLTYLDVNGRAVNTAGYGASAWQIGTTEYDRRGNTIRSLSAGNRNDALTPTANPDLDPYVASVPNSAARADLLSETTVYSTDGVDELSSVGPMHPVVLDDGTTASAREHTTTTYDQGAPGAGYRLPTTSVTAAQTPDGVDHDARTTWTGYDPLGSDPSGWTLRAATKVTTDMPGATPDIVKQTRYNDAGQVIETRMPSDQTGTGAGTSLTTYYTATPGSTVCDGKAYWAGLACQTKPKAQPATGPNLPTTTTTYTLWDAPDTVTEVAGTTTRTTVSGYDGAGRPTGTTLTVTPTADGGAPVPAVTTGYDSATGLATTTSSTAGTITVGYDAVGQATSYTQTAGGTTVTSATTTYDIAGRVNTVADGKGTTTYTYDSTTDHRGNALSAADTLAGTTTTTYDADGTADTITYPGGLTATTATDNDGNATRLTYAKSGTTWMTFTQTESIHGQVRTASGPTGRQLDTYDAAARLARVDDLTGAVCTRRDYGFDANTNRTSLTTTVGTEADPTPTALCDLTGATPATTTSTYDAADRTTGHTYDNLGRTTAVPAGAVTGGAALTLGYSANDMVNTLTQAGRTKTYTLDPANRIATIADSTGAPTLTNHYTGGGDNPAWIGASDGTWTRYVAGPAGGLGLSVTNTGAVRLQLANLHGDIVSTCAPTDTLLPNYTDTTEYGLPRNTTDPQARYGWLGGHRRDTGDALAGLTLMGARLYNPTTGRFLSVDPVYGGSCNTYDYTCADPINGLDLDGKMRCRWCRSAAKWGARSLKYTSTALSWCTLPQCQAASLATGLASAGLYYAAGKRGEARSQLIGTAYSVLTGGFGRVGRLGGTRKLSRLYNRGARVYNRVGRWGGAYGSAWKRAGRYRSSARRWHVRTAVATAWYYGNLHSSCARCF